ncbi:MAG TPA: adenylosuccinate lyase [Syntrophorhabdaceae bacterium]|nr:adenylosuccinate lyase [Syntrophorhabdaceae bacterium]HOT42659.1 adenylosuccinate lyase [Syntrophorhabdaceae bacterium]HPC66446.1 adenylosuccinate lyase [Syntrophorhabdaceae bacterium]HQH43993.1 adenylosuccinate lyase [Syntrophorhabdaceae bacterium]HQK47141.1 adenylosuccinate lyase [Syntrophorhabdaceae bacterium]
MIKRYSLKRMTDIWEEENKFRKWLEIEVLICEAYAKLGIIPEEDLKNIKEKAGFSIARIQEIEARTRHDVVAFIECISEYIGPSSKYVHMGVTSSDILDTSFSLLLKEASGILIDDIKAFMEVLKETAIRYKDTPMIGRTHGIHAEPITFGLKMAHFYHEMKRNLERMEKARDGISYGKISGAVGTFAHVQPSIESYVCERLGLKPAPISTQIIPRDYYAEFFTTLSIIASSIEKMALEIRNLQRTEVGEAEEYFQKGQTGSSAMPHKRNPIASENLCGLARLIRGYALSSLENIPLWHERDISHSSVERVIAPDATILLDYMLERIKNMYKNLIIYPERMEKNLEITKGLYHSEAVLLSLIMKGLTRQEAYRLTQGVAMRCFEKGLDFKEELLKDPGLRRYLDEKEINEITDISHYFRYVDTIFERVFG